MNNFILLFTSVKKCVDNIFFKKISNYNIITQFLAMLLSNFISGIISTLCLLYIISKMMYETYNSSIIQEYKVD